MEANQMGMALADPSVVVSLRDGSTTTFQVTMFTLARIEDEFGSLDAMREALSGEGDAKMFRSLGKVFGLLMEPERTADEALKLLDVQRLDDYTGAMERAFELAFPDANPTQAEEPVPTSSLGTSGSISAPSYSAEPTPSSGV